MYLSVLSLAGLLFVSPLTVAADDLETSLQALKDAVAKKDAAEVKKLALETSKLAREVASAPAPQNPADKDAWAKRTAYGKEVDVYTEYALYSTAVASEPETTIDLFATLEQQNPKSKYLDCGYAPYFLALTKTGAADKIIAVAEKALASLPNDPDLLLILADSAISKKQAPRAGAYAERALTALRSHAKPEVLSAAEWDAKKSTALGRAYWVAGMVHAERNEFYAANQDLRGALPYIKGQSAMLAAAYFFLSLANYNLGRQSLNPAQVREAANFSELCSKIPGPYQQQAWTNTSLMRAEADKMLLRK
jgi:uncharacterized protein HemY